MTIKIFFNKLKRRIMPELLNIEKNNAIKAYNEGDAQDKRLLVNLFGQSHFDQKITDRVKTFADILAIKGMTQCEFDSKYGSRDDNDIAFVQAKFIAEVLNEGWKADHSNDNEAKYEPRFVYKSGVGLSFYDYVYRSSHTDVGARLCYKSASLAMYAGTQFIDIFRRLLS